MKTLIVAIAFFFMHLGMAQFGDIGELGGFQKGINQKPEFYILNWQPGMQLAEKTTALSIEVDSMGLQPLKALVDVNGRTVLYTSDISTPVCADGDCRSMEIRLYWTLLGEYAGFDRYRNAPLTKHDHDEFLSADYLKLHQLLMDDNSILKRRKIDELVDKPKQPEMEGVDAVAGATIKEVKESVVGGALYSCYSAWHLVHGPVKEQIKKRTLESLDNEKLFTMLQSNNSDYQLFVLKKLSESQYESNYVRIAEVFEIGIPLVRTFVIKNLPESFWDSEQLQKPFWESFSKVDINSRSLLLDHLENSPESVMKNLSGQLKGMTKNQLKIYLEYLASSEKINPQIKANLENFSSSDTEINAYLVTYFLEDYEQ